MRLIISLLLVMVFISCNDDKKIPDVSNIKIALTTSRFERDLFNLDSIHFASGFSQLAAKYPSFTDNYFLSEILNIDPAWPTDSINNYVASFVSSYRKIYDTAEIVFKDFTPYENEIKNGLQFLQYYFPDYKAPHQIITYIGPVDGYGDIITDDALVVGLHAHLGKDYAIYKSSWVEETYPEYLSARFEPSYISVNCMRNIVLDIFPDKNEDKTLVVQMIEKGKRLYMLNRLLPKKEEYKLIGYTATQLKDCYAGESKIWDLFVQNNFLQTTGNNATKNYVTEGPKTQELGDDSPGNIGSFVGWQIVKKYMDKNPETSLPQLMTMDAETIFNQAKYKP